MSARRGPASMARGLDIDGLCQDMLWGGLQYSTFFFFFQFCFFWQEEVLGASLSHIKQDIVFYSMVACCWGHVLKWEWNLFNSIFKLRKENFNDLIVSPQQSKVVEDHLRDIRCSSPPSYWVQDAGWQPCRIWLRAPEPRQACCAVLFSFTFMWENYVHVSACAHTLTNVCYLNYFFLVLLD